VPSFTLDTVICKNVSYVFGNTTSTTASTTYLWDFGDGVTSTTPSPSHAYNAGGIYTITLSATNQYGCDSSYTRTVKVVEPPVAQFVESPREGCGPLSVTFTDQSTGYLVNPTYNWNFGNGTTANTQGPHTVVFNASLYQDTLYLVTQTVGNLCGSTTYIDSVIVHPTPTAYFGTNLSSGCSPLTISFSNNSYGLPTSFLWNFGDGTTDTSRVPAPHTFYAYTQDTVYYISLIAINDCGTNTYVDSVLVHPNTTNAFFNTSPDKGCAPLTVTFTNYSIGGTIYAWDFGDGNVSNQYNTTHTYINPGIYTASFIITNNCSYDTAYVSIEVWPQPTLSFTSSVDTVCINSAVQFNNTSATPLTNIVWDFGDGTGSVLSNPSHTYLNAGTFLVSMIGTGGPHGCSDTTYKYIVVKPLPIAAYDSLYFEGCQPFVANFINQSTGGVSGVLWDFGDGNTSAAFNATHVYLNAGIFYPLLTVQTQYGCVDTARGEVIVHPKPTSLFTFSPDSSCGAPIVVQFNNQSVLGSGANWSFTDGQTSTQISPAMTFTQVGTLGVQLIAISDFGCKDTSADQFVVYPKPIADIAVVDPRGCEDFTPVFINNSTNAISYSWTFGDGFTSTDQLPIHTYTDDGNYIVTLAIEGLGGCKDSTTLSSTITVIPGPTADFSYTPALNPTNYGWIYFTNLSVYDVSWHWNFDDGSNSTLENPDHQYNANGVYNVELIAYAANGCTDTIVKPIKPTYFDGLFVPNAFAPDKGNNGDMYRVFYPQGKSLSSYHVWVYDTFGILIWESTALKNGSPSEWWDGTRDGSLLPSDVYIWKVEATFENGDIWPGQFNPEQGLKRITGNVTLIR
jgi:PKD repeat protein